MTSRMFTPDHIPKCFARSITHSDHRIESNQKSDYFKGADTDLDHG